MGTVTISGDFVQHVRHALTESLKYALTGRGVRHGNNAYTPHAFPAYVSAVASVESFFNEALLGTLARAILRDSPLWKIQGSVLDRLDLKLKLIIVPQLLFGSTFDPSNQPYQDFALLIRVRNDVVHYKMRDAAPGYLKPLEDRGIALTADHEESDADYPWPSKLSSSEGIRWAHNAACAVVQGLVQFMPEEHRPTLGTLAANFEEIPESLVAGLLAAGDLEP